MIVLIFIVNALAILSEEIEDYQIAFMITNTQEDYIIIQDELNQKDYNQNAIKIYDKIGLIREINHTVDQIIYMKQNDFELEDQIWILYKIDNKSILSQQSIFDEQTYKNYYLNLNFQCYTFYFITKSQIIIDCQDKFSNLLVLYDIQHQIQQSFYHSRYKQVRLRKLLQIHQSNSFVFIQQEKFLILCQYQNKYQVCNQLTYENDAHTVYMDQNIITLIADYSIGSLRLYGNEFDQIQFIDEQVVADKQQGIDFPIKFYVKQTKSKQYIVYSDKILLCEQYCLTFLINFPIYVEMQQNYLIVQTQQTIEIFSLHYSNMLTIRRQFDNEIVFVNGMLQEFYIANKSRLSYYGLTYTPYFRVNKSTNIIYNYNFVNYYQFQSYDNNVSIQFDSNFVFKTYHLKLKQKSFVLVGGMLNITFSVEDKFKDLIKINHYYFSKNQYMEVQYFFLHLDQLQKISLLIVQDNQLIKYDLMQMDQNQSNLTEINIDLRFLEKIQSYNHAYQMKDTRNGQQYLITFNGSNLQAVKIGCDSNFILFACKIRLYICIYMNEIRFHQLQINQMISLKKNSNERFLFYDEENRILFLANDTYLIINFYETHNYPTVHTQLIRLCFKFINIAVLQYKLVLVCEEQMILYNKISNFRFVISGNIELYGSKFANSSLIIQNDNNLFYIIDDNMMHVFNSDLPLTQLYVTIMQIDKFDDVKSQNQDICFQYNQNLKCYSYQIKIKFNYDDDLVEYHQVFKVDVCGENKYSKKCKQYITRLDQQNRKISVKKPTFQMVIKKNTKEIILNQTWFSGTIEKIYVNNYLLKPKFQMEAYLEFKSMFAKQAYYSFFDKSIYILNDKQLFVYNVETRQTQKMATNKPMRYFIRNDTNSLLLTSYYYISVLNCEFECKEIINLDLKFILQGILYLHNNLLYTTSFTQLKIYNIQNMINNISYQPIQEDLDIYLIDISEDLNQEICMIYLNFQNKLFFRYQGKINKYDIKESFQQQGVGLEQYQYDIMRKIKLLCNCKILFIDSQFGAYFIELQEELKFLAQIVVQYQFSFQINRILEGRNYLFYIQQLEDQIILFRFTYHQIYYSKYIDFYQKLDLRKWHNFSSYHFYTYNDDLFLIQPDIQGFIIYKINQDLLLQLEYFQNHDELLITLTNQDQTKQFHLEILFEESYYYLIYWALVAFLLILFICLKYQKIRKQM